MSNSPSDRSEGIGPNGDQSGDHDCLHDIRRMAKILRDGGHTYDQSNHLIAEGRLKGKR